MFKARGKPTRQGQMPLNIVPSFFYSPTFVHDFVTDIVIRCVIKSKHIMPVSYFFLIALEKTGFALKRPLHFPRNGYELTRRRDIS